MEVKRKMILLYLGYLGTTNVGDEVCYEAFQQSLQQWNYANKKQYKVITFPIFEKISIQEFYTKTPFDAIILGGGSLLQSALFLHLVEEAQKIGIPVFGYGTGIDYLTEHSIENYRQEQDISITEFFDNRNIDFKKITNVIKKAEFIGVRGPLTYQSLLTYESDLKNIDVIGDAAIAYTPKQDSYITEKYLTEPENRFVAINWGTTLNKLFGYNEMDLLKELVKSCEFLQSKGYHLVIFPMWDVDIIPCQKLYSNLYQVHSATLIPEVCTSAQIYTLLKKVDFSINLKLHANVLSAAALTPFINLAYRSKGMDFSFSLNCQTNSFLTNKPNLTEFITEREHAFCTQRKRLVNQLSKYQKYYAEKQLSFFNTLANIQK